MSYKYIEYVVLLQMHKIQVYVYVYRNRNSWNASVLGWRQSWVRCL